MISYHLQIEHDHFTYSFPDGTSSVNTGSAQNVNICLISMSVEHNTLNSCSVEHIRNTAMHRYNQTVIHTIMSILLLSGKDVQLFQEIYIYVSI